MARVSIVTLGCPKNAVDSEGLGGLISSAGHDLVEAPEGADVVVVNTCGFIDPARRETVQEVLDLAGMKESGDLQGLILTGCLVAREPQELADSLPEVDALVDFAAYPQLSSIVDGVLDGTLNERVHGTPGTRFDPAYWDALLEGGPRVRFGRAPWSYLKIAEGCDRGCTFCSIPLMRGKFRSRPLEVIEREARHLVAQGISELSLVSQDSVMWGRDGDEGSLATILDRLETIEDLRRVRLMYLHPQGVSEELIERIASSEKIVSYFDLSLQHVSPSVLKRMGRWGGAARFEKMIDRIRGLDPLAGIRTTYIMGFPGETDEDAEAVSNFVAQNDVDWIGVFTYSREEGTRSHDLEEQVPAAVARERAEQVSGIADQVMERRARSLIGTTFEVLVERFDLEDQMWVGRSKREAPEIDGEIRFTTEATPSVGDYLAVKITDSDGADLSGVTALETPLAS